MKEIEKKFNDLYFLWKSETEFLSTLKAITANKSYREIIGLGRAVLPYIFRKMQKLDDWWFAALKEITGADPVEKEDIGNLSRMTAAWLGWAIDKKYIKDARRSFWNEICDYCDKDVLLQSTVSGRKRHYCFDHANREEDILTRSRLRALQIKGKKIWRAPK